MAAGLGFKTFTTGEVLTSTDTNGYLMQGVLVFADAAARTAAITSPQEGQTSYLKDTDVIQVYSGSAWVTKSAGAAGGETTFTLLNTGGTALTGAQTVTISSIGGYASYFILVIDASSASANSQIIVRPNGDATSTNYYHGGFVNTPTTSYTIGTFAASSSYRADANSMLLGQTASDAASQARGSLIFWGGKSTGIKAWQSAGAGDNYGGAQNWNQTTRNGLFNLTSAITSFDIRSSTGNWDSGTVYVFGGSI